MGLFKHCDTLMGAKRDLIASLFFVLLRMYYPITVVYFSSWCHLVDYVLRLWHFPSLFFTIQLLITFSSYAAPHYEDVPLRKHAYSNIQKILPPKNENFQVKNSGIFHISAHNIDCEYSLEPPQRGGSNEYPQSIF